MNLEFKIESSEECPNCKKGEFHFSEYNITIEKGLVICAICKKPVTANLEITNSDE